MPVSWQSVGHRSQVWHYKTCFVSICLISLYMPVSGRLEGHWVTSMTLSASHQSICGHCNPYIPIYICLSVCNQWATGSQVWPYKICFVSICLMSFYMCFSGGLEGHMVTCMTLSALHQSICVHCTILSICL